MLTLEQIQEVDHGEYLTKVDLDYANQLLSDGLPEHIVWSRIEGWAADYNFEAFADSRAARDFEDWAYGRKDW
jgi:hypothetical protein